MNHWDKKFLDMAKQVSTWSKDPSTCIGAIIVGKNRNVLSTGYNGFPRGIEDKESRLNDRPTKYKFVVHGELNAILNAAFNGTALESSTIYVYGLPVCPECAKAIIQCGISRVVMLLNEDSPNSKKWIDAFDEITKPLFDEAGIQYQLY